MAKTEFNSGESLILTFEPFINPSTGLVIETGDTVTIVVTAPDGSHPSGPAATRDGTTFIWGASISVGSYQSGKWLFRATSNDASAPNPQYRTVFWGSGTAEDILTTKTAAAAIKAKTDNLPAAPAATGDVTSATSTITTAVSTSTSTTGTAIASAATAIEASVEGAGAHTVLDIFNRLGAPAGASLAADIASVKVDTLKTRKVSVNRLKIDPIAFTTTIYDDDGTTPLVVWDDKDDLGAASTARIFERVPH